MAFTFELNLKITGSSLDEIDNSLVEAAGQRLRARMVMPANPGPAGVPPGLHFKGPGAGPVAAATPPTVVHPAPAAAPKQIPNPIPTTERAPVAAPASPQNPSALATPAAPAPVLTTPANENMVAANLPKIPPGKRGRPKGYSPNKKIEEKGAPPTNARPNETKTEEKTIPLFGESEQQGNSGHAVHADAPTAGPFAPTQASQPASIAPQNGGQAPAKTSAPTKVAQSSPPGLVEAVSALKMVNSTLNVEAAEECLAKFNVKRCGELTDENRQDFIDYCHSMCPGVPAMA